MGGGQPRPGLGSDVGLESIIGGRGLGHVALWRGALPPHGTMAGTLGSLRPLAFYREGGGDRGQHHLSITVIAGGFYEQSWGRSPANRLSFCPSLVTYSWWEGEA